MSVVNNTVKLDNFSATAPIVFFRTYSRRTDEGKRESWEEVTERTNNAIAAIGKFTPEEKEISRRMQSELKAIPSGRWLWMGGTEWGERPTNYYGAYNCCSLNISGWEDFARNFNYSMQGCGVGAVLELANLEKLPTIVNQIELEIVGEYGDVPPEQRISQTTCIDYTNYWDITVGDSREGWNKVFLQLLELSSNTALNGIQKAVIDVSHVRPAGTPLKGFGGVANPIGLKNLFRRVVEILNKAVGRKLDWIETCLLLDEAGKCTVAGNIRRSAGMRQLSPEDEIAIAAKYNLWQQGADGSWKIDPLRDALRMANHTRVFHHKPSEQECIDAVRSQWLCGEGAIQWAGEAVARANADLLDTEEKKKTYLGVYRDPASVAYLYTLYYEKYGTYLTKGEAIHRLLRYGLNPCFRGDMQLLTVDGYKRFDELDGKEVQIINAYGEISDSKVWCSGEKEIVRLLLSNKKEIFCTPDHVFMTIAGEEVPASNSEGKQLMPFVSSKGSMPRTRESALLWTQTVESVISAGVAKVYDFSESLRHWGVVEGFVAHNCGEEFGTDFFCNLSEIMLNRLDPLNSREQEEALRAASLNVAALLHQTFPDEKMQRSRELDPRVGVGICGVFDFFVNAFGGDYLRWWKEGRPSDWLLNVDGATYKDVEQQYLERWRDIVHDTIWEYCDRHNLKRPNRCTTVQPSGTKALLTGASPGWQVPYSNTYLRRITIAKNDPVGLACLDCGYRAIPENKDENGNLLPENAIWDEQCHNWLIEIPVRAPWADLADEVGVEVRDFTALAKFDFYMQVQKYWTRSNTSGTINLTESEIEAIGRRIHEAIANDEGYISVCFLAKDEETFPRMPFEPIDRDRFQSEVNAVESRRTASDFETALAARDDSRFQPAFVGPAGCDSDKCLLPEKH